MLVRQITNNELNQLSMLDQEVNLTPWNLANYEQSILDSNHTILGIFLNNNELVGACTYSQIVNEAEILQLVIAKQFQRQGYAEYLLNQVINRLKEVQVKQIFLEVLINNLPAIKLYDKLGFNQVGLRKNYYKMGNNLRDALIMGKTCL